jgi:hypothetical protein
MVNLSPELAGRAGSVVVAGASVRTAKVEHQPPSAWNELPRVIDDRTRPPGTVLYVVAETGPARGPRRHHPRVPGRLQGHGVGLIRRPEVIAAEWFLVLVIVLAVRSGAASR